MNSLPDHLKNISILIVDDMSFYHSLLQQSLGILGHTGKIYSATGKNEAIKLMNDIYKSKNKVDFIVSDLHLKDGTGIEFAAKIRAHPVLSNIPFVLFTTEDNSKLIIEGINAGIDNYFFKPITHEVFLEKIVFCWNKRNAQKTK